MVGEVLKGFFKRWSILIDISPKKLYKWQMNRSVCSSSLAIREVQIQTEMRYDSISTRMAKIKNMDNNKCWWRCGKIGDSYIVCRIIT